MNFPSDGQLLYACKFFGGGVLASLVSDILCIFLPVKSDKILSFFKAVFSFVGGCAAFLFVYFSARTGFVMVYMPVFLVLGMLSERKTIGKTLAFIHLKVYNILKEFNSKIFSALKKAASKIKFRSNHGQTKVKKTRGVGRFDGDTVIVYSHRSHDIPDVRHKKQRKSYKRT